MTDLILRAMLAFMGFSAIILVIGVIAGIVEVAKLVKEKVNAQQITPDLH